VLRGHRDIIFWAFFFFFSEEEGLQFTLGFMHDCATGTFFFRGTKLVLEFWKVPTPGGFPRRKEKTEIRRGMGKAIWLASITSKLHIIKYCNIAIVLITFCIKNFNQWKEWDSMLYFCTKIND
jgi:hypothetical protein